MTTATLDRYDRAQSEDSPRAVVDSTVPPTLIFLHIPKSAGCTLLEIIARQYSAEQTYDLYGNDVQRAMDTLLNQDDHRKRTIRCIRGHIPFGLHRYLPQRGVYLAMLRDPVERTISEYYYVKRTDTHAFHDRLVGAEMSLEDYVRAMVDSGEFNLQTRWLSGRVDLERLMPPYEPLTDDALDDARRNIDEYFRCVGLTERFDESLLMMKQALDWRNIRYVRQNVTADRPKRDDVSHKVIRMIERHNHLDMELHAEAGKRLDAWLASAPCASMRRRVFACINAAYGWWSTRGDTQ